MRSLWLFLAACNPDGPKDTNGPTVPAPVPSPTTDPQLLVVEITQPNDIAPLSRHLHVETSEATTLTARWDDGARVTEVVWQGSAAVHDHTLLGFNPGTNGTLTVTATSDRGVAEGSEPLAFEAWPTDFPIGELTTAGAASPGHTIVPLNTSNATLPVRAAVVVYDEVGLPCFLLEINDQLEDAIPYGDGLLVTSGLEQRIARYFRWDGTEEWAFTLDASAVAPQIPVQSALAERFHHDVVPFPGETGHFYALGRSPMDLDQWRASYSDPGVRADRIVSDDILLDFNLDGSVNGELKLSDVIPVDRIGFDSLEEVYPGWADWTHANSVLWDDGSYVVSLRHQDAVVKIDATTHEIQWILGTHDNWMPPWSDALLTPEGDLRWQWHQHAARIGPRAADGRAQVMVFDNGNWQASPFTGVSPVTDPKSRVVQFGIDEANQTVRMDWSYEVSTVAGAALFSEAVGDADYLPNGQILATWGMLLTLPDGTPNLDAEIGNRTIRIIEFDPATLTDVWHLYLSVSAFANDDGWTAYRSERIPSLYGRTVD